MTLLIDADWLLHSACAACECDIRWDEWINTLHLEQSDVKDFIAMKLDFWRGITDDYGVVMCFSDYPTFRHELNDGYKANRIGKRKPLGMRDIRHWIQENYESRTLRGLEADDVLGLFATGASYKNPIIVSIDKDMRTIPCSLLAVDQVETVSPADANRAWMLQALTGDSTDNYSGLKGVGPVSAAKILGDTTDLAEMWEKVLAAYRKAGLTFKDALLNARMARILRYGDYDFAAGTVQLWDPDCDPALKPNG
jgi:DNA polymerase-1